MTYDQMGGLAVLGVFLLAGLICIGLAAWLGWRDYHRARTWCVAEGKVIRQIESSDIMSYESSFLPVVEFTDNRGRVVRASSSVAGSRARHTAGTTVRVCYRPEDPKKIQIIWEYRGVAAFLGLTGLVLSLGAAALIAHVLNHGVPAR